MVAIVLCPEAVLSSPMYSSKPWQKQCHSSLSLHLLFSHSLWLYQFLWIPASISFSSFLLPGCDFSSLFQLSRFIYSPFTLQLDLNFLYVPWNIGEFQLHAPLKSECEIIPLNSSFWSRFKIRCIVLIWNFLWLKYWTHLWHYDDILLYFQNSSFFSCLYYKKLSHRKIEIKVW